MIKSNNFVRNSDGCVRDLITCNRSSSVVIKIMKHHHVSLFLLHEDCNCDGRIVKKVGDSEWFSIIMSLEVPGRDHGSERWFKSVFVSLEVPG
jgi:hypothetical protein